MKQPLDIPDKFLIEGLFVSNRQLVKPGDTVEAKRDVNGSIETLVKGVRYKVEAFVPSNLGTCTRHFRLQLEGQAGHFNPKRFRKVDKSDK